MNIQEMIFHYNIGGHLDEEFTKKFIDALVVENASLHNMVRISETTEKGAIEKMEVVNARINNYIYSLRHLNPDQKFLIADQVNVIVKQYYPRHYEK